VILFTSFSGSLVSRISGAVHRREFAIWAKAVVQVLETLPDILERDCGLQPAAVSRVQSIIDDLRDQIALRVTEAGADDEEELQQEE
ncbi:DUF1441 family protein, partial [Escherichia coli]|uniref:DUF1441 family protein n=1 Tax=Escherichia coli TaxID=562 RepID=UPI000AF6C820